jgi:cyclopropane fatty-acyl-phospholipid synthase-like methyltransferase
MNRKYVFLTFCIALGYLLLSAGAAPAQMHHGGYQHSFEGAEYWAKEFDDPARDNWQKPHQVIRALALRPGSVIADIGAGTGYFSVRLARMTPGGRVYGVDIEPDMVKYLGERAKKAGLKNVIPVAGAPDDPRLPEKVDLVLMVDVFHHIGDRDRYLAVLHGLLKPGGRIAIIDFRMDWPEGPPRSVRLTPEQVKAELGAAGYEFVDEHDFLPKQYFLVFKVVEP